MCVEVIDTPRTLILEGCTLYYAASHKLSNSKTDGVTGRVRAERKTCGGSKGALPYPSPVAVSQVIASEPPWDASGRDKMARRPRRRGASNRRGVLDDGAIPELLPWWIREKLSARTYQERNVGDRDTWRVMGIRFIGNIKTRSQREHLDPQLNRCPGMLPLSPTRHCVVGSGLLPVSAPVHLMFRMAPR
jgi:hypothetical protein